MQICAAHKQITKQARTHLRSHARPPARKHMHTQAPTHTHLDEAAGEEVVGNYPLTCLGVRA